MVLFVVFLLQLIWVSIKRQRAWCFKLECTNHLFVASNNIRDVLVKIYLVKVDSVSFPEAYEISSNITKPYFNCLVHWNKTKGFFSRLLKHWKPHCRFSNYFETLILKTGYLRILNHGSIAAFEFQHWPTYFLSY